MDMRDLFLASTVPCTPPAVGGNKASAAERVLNGLTDEQMRVAPAKTSTPSPGSCGISRGRRTFPQSGARGA